MVTAVEMWLLWEKKVQTTTTEQEAVTHTGPSQVCKVSERERERGLPWSDRSLISDHVIRIEDPTSLNEKKWFVLTVTHPNVVVVPVSVASSYVYISAWA